MTKIPTASLFSSLAVSLICAVGSAASPTAMDFLPPAMGGPTEIKKPNEVKVSAEVVQAADAQDAINAAVQANVGQIEDNDFESQAVRVQFGSGWGYVATGSSQYRASSNLDLSRISKRKAYVIAFAIAKKKLAETLNGINISGQESVRQTLATVSLPDQETLANIATNTDECRRQAVQMMLRGFVVYEVKDATDQDTVYVSIATSPKTVAAVGRQAPHAINADSLAGGLTQVIAEIKSGIVPPVGGKIVNVPKTGETAFVGFGSAVVRSNSNSVVQSRLKYESRRIAEMRAKDALTSFLQGNETSWRGGLVDKYRDEIKQFEQRDDPLLPTDPAAYRKLDQERDTMISTLKTSNVYQSVVNGRLPAGVTTKNWYDSDGSWSYGMSVYIPSHSQAAADFANKVREAGSGAGAGSKSPLPKVKAKPGPTGKVSNKDDL
jgi:hypothetical protein